MSASPHAEPLQVTEADGLCLPDEYADLEGGVGLVIRAPQITLDMKPNTHPKGYFSQAIVPRHWSDEGELQNPELLPDQVSLKQYGEDAEVFRVELPEEVPV